MNTLREHLHAQFSAHLECNLRRTLDICQSEKMFPTKVARKNKTHLSHCIRINILRND